MNSIRQSTTYRYCYLSGLALIFLISSAPAYAIDRDITVSIMKFTQVDDPDPRPGLDLISGPDNRGAGDYYFRIRIGNNSFVRNRGDFIEASSIARTDWSVTQSVEEQPTVPVIIQMWDADTIENNDDKIDINELDDVQDLTIVLNLVTCNWTSDAGANIPVSRGDGDTEHFGALEGGDRGEISFAISCADSIDTDEDGIPDSVERFGIFDDSGNQIQDMAELGADPCRPDVAVVIDFMTDSGHTHAPKAGVIDAVIDGFERADIDPIAADDCPYPGFPSADGIGLLTILGDGIDEQTPISMELLATLKENFAPELWPYFHYGLFAHSIDGGRSGRCCNEGKDFVVSLGSFSETAAQQSGTFMHELGHALGLAHSGSSSIDTDANGDMTGRNCKPNYLSVMNYFFQFAGLTDDDTGTVSFDYSASKLPTLRESALDETLGIGNGSTQTTWCGAMGIQAGTAARGDGPIDWNEDSDGGSDTSVSQDIAATTASGGSCCQSSGGSFTASPDDTLVGFDDWANLRFRAQFAAGANDPIEVVDNEPTPEEAEVIINYWEQRRRCFPPESGDWVVSGSCTIWRDVTAPADLIVSGNAVLRIGEGVKLGVDLATHAIRVAPGARLQIAPGASVGG